MYRIFLRRVKFWIWITFKDKLACDLLRLLLNGAVKVLLSGAVRLVPSVAVRVVVRIIRVLLL